MEHCKMQPLQSPKSETDRCRVCLVDHTDGLSIYTNIAINEENIQFIDLLVICTNIKILHEDQKPKTICNHCIEEAITSYMFKITCENSDKILEVELNNLSVNTCIKIESIPQCEEVVISEDKLEQDTRNEYFQNNNCMPTSIPVCEGNKEETIIENVSILAVNDKTCRECGKEFQLRRYMLAHRNRQHKKPQSNKKTDGELKYKTVPKTNNTIVKAEFNDDSLKSPIKKISIESISSRTCSDCDKVFNSRKSMLAHKKRHKKLNLKCQEKILKIVKAEFKDDSVQSPTTKISIESISYRTCSECGKVCNSRKSLWAHKKGHKKLNLKCQEKILKIVKAEFKDDSVQSPTTKISIESISYRTCSECGKVCNSRKSLWAHKKGHEKLNLKCLQCGKHFFRKINLSRHLLIHSGVKKFVCEVCGLSFAMQNYLTTHIRTHTGEKPYSCPECGKSFAQQSSLKSHLISHRATKDYVCAECGAAYKRSKDLCSHKKIHSGVKENLHKCTICNKSFSKVSWKRHMKIHTGERLFKCDVCLKRFQSSSSLKVHAMIHTGETPHKCNICGKGFIQAHCLRTHLNTHKIETKNS